MIGLIAQDSTGRAGGIAGLLVPLLLMGGLFYFLMIRPQQRRSRSQKLLRSRSGTLVMRPPRRRSPGPA